MIIEIDLLNPDESQEKPEVSEKETTCEQKEEWYKKRRLQLQVVTIDGKVESI